MSKFSGEAVAVYILLSDYSSVLNILIEPRFSCWTKQTNFETKIQTSYVDSIKKVTQHSEARHLLLEGGGNQTPQSQQNDKQLQFLQCCIFRKAIHLSHINQVPQQRLWALYSRTKCIQKDFSHRLCLWHLSKHGAQRWKLPNFCSPQVIPDIAAHISNKTLYSLVYSYINVIACPFSSWSQPN